MANYTISQFPLLLKEDVGSWISTNLTSLPTTVYDDTEDDITIVGSGSDTFVLPLTSREQETDGSKAISFLDDYYYRIHIEPNPIELGVILSQITRTFQVWNAYFTSKECSSIEESGVDELTLVGNSAPYTLAALGTADYSLTIPANGNPEIDGEYEFIFPEESPSLIITGQRVVLFSWRPQQPLSETLEWLTDVITSADGSEQRICLREAPRQGFIFSILALDESTQSKLDAALFGWQKKIWGVPIWECMTEHTADITAGDLSISLDTTNKLFEDGGIAVIWQSADNYEVIKINTVSASSITLNSAVINNFTGSKLIIPVKTANIIAKSKSKHNSKDVSWTEIQFLARNNSFLSGYSAATTYKSIPVLTEASYVEGTQDREFDSVIHITDFGTGDIDVISDREYNLNTQRQVFINEGRANCYSFRKFLHWLKGRQNIVWIPSFREDMRLASTIGSSDSTITIENIGYVKHYLGNPVKNHIMIRKADGTQYYREITGAVAGSGNNEVLTIDSALGEELQPTDVVISFMARHRLNSDALEIVWDDINTNKCSASFVAVKE